MDDKIKLCFVAHNAGLYGADKCLYELINGLDFNQVECLVFFPYEGELIDKLNRIGVRCYILPPVYRWMSYGRPFWKKMAFSLINIITSIILAIKIKKEKIDIVLTNTIIVNVGALASFFARIPHIWLIHEFGDIDHGLSYDLGKRLSPWLVNKLSSFIIFNSNAVANHFSKFISWHKSKIIYYYSISLAATSNGFVSGNYEFIKTSKECLRLVIVGILRKGKGQEDAIRAVSECIKRGMKIELWVIGDGDNDYIKFLYDLVRTENLNNYVRFLGFQENPFFFIEKSDVALMCSRNEAFGRVTLETMACGKPVIGTNSGGTPEFVKNGVNGLLYKPGDCMNLADKIEYLYKNREVILKLGNNAKEFAKVFTSDKRKYSEKVTEIVTKVLDEQRQKNVCV